MSVGAFRLMTYHPNCCSLHSSIQCNYCVINTGGTFGNNTSPSNFDPIGMAWRQLAQSLRQTVATAAVLAKGHLLDLNLAPPPTPEEVAAFAQADCDELNTGVLGNEGGRKSPLYNMHVDDVLYADIGQYTIDTICVSILALFWVLGFPSTPLVPPPLRTDKFDSFYNHERCLAGQQFNSRTKYAQWARCW